MRCGFKHLISVIPEGHVAVENLAHQVGIDEHVLSATLRNGLSRIPIADEHTTASLAAQAVADLLAQRSDLCHCIEAVVLAHSLPMPAPPGVDLLAPCLHVGSLEHKPAVVVTGQPCAILHSAIQVARTWLAGLPAESGVLIIGVDVANQPEERFFFNSAMGDAAIAGVLTRGASRNIVMASVTDTHVVAYNGELSPPESIARFRAANPSAIRVAIERCLSVAGIALNDVALIVPHTPNISVWIAVADLLRLPYDRIITRYIGETGHMNSNDSFAHFLRATREGRLVRDDLALLVNPGFGGSRGCTLLRV